MAKMSTARLADAVFQDGSVLPVVRWLPDIARTIHGRHVTRKIGYEAHCGGEKLSP
jgi:hypothetical protein